MTQTRRLAAILAADVAGYSRLTGADEEGTLAALQAIRRELVDPRIAEHRGRIVISMPEPHANPGRRELNLSSLRLAMGDTTE
jgi:class 3 adenylate cyclase